MEEIRLREKLFGGEIEITIFDVEREDAHDILLEAYTEALRLQKIFNFYDKESVISTLNKKRKLKVPKEFLEVLQPALTMSKETKGLYDVTHGENFKKRKRGKTLQKLTCSADDIHIEEDEVEITNEEATLDFGSLAKGYITDKIATFLKQKKITSGLIDARGDILTFGNQEHTIAIANPRESNKTIDAIKLQNHGVATSGDYMQYEGTYDTNHVVNNKDYASVSIVATNLMEADLYATVLLVVGTKKAQAILKKQTHLKALCIRKDLNIETYNGFETLETSYEQPTEEGPFTRDALHGKKGNKRIGPVGSEGEDTRDVEEWFIDDEPFPENAREIFVRPSKKYEHEFSTRAS